VAGCCFGDRERSEIGVPGDPGGVDEGVRGILVRGPLEIAGGGDLVKSPGEPEGRILGELEWP